MDLRIRILTSAPPLSTLVLSGRYYIMSNASIVINCIIFHENRLLAEDSHVISYLIFVKYLGKMLQNLSSAAVVIGALRVNILLR